MNIDDAIAEATWAGQSELDAYLAGRRRAADIVRETLRRIGFRGQVGGSWSRGDFHRSREGRSFSDLDLYMESGDEAERIALANRTERGLQSSGLTMHVSVHSNNSFAVMDPGDWKLFCVLELLLGSLASQGDYALAKAVLMLGRQDTNEHPRSAAIRLGALGLFHVKVGACDSFLDEGTRRVAHANRVGSHTLGEWLADPAASMSELATFFETRASESGEWIYQRGLLKARAQGRF